MAMAIAITTIHTLTKNKEPEGICIYAQITF